MVGAATPRSDPLSYKLGDCHRAGCRGHSCRTDHSYCDLCANALRQHLKRVGAIKEDTPPLISELEYWAGEMRRSAEVVGAINSEIAEGNMRLFDVLVAAQKVVRRGVKLERVVAACRGPLLPACAERTAAFADLDA